MATRNKFLSGAAIVATVVFGAGNAGAQVVQQGQAGDPAESASDPDSDDRDTDANDEIVVTGSRIITSKYGSPSPINVTDAEDLRRSGDNNVYATFLKSPLFAPGVGNGTSGSLSKEVGVSFLNLRNLGTNRTLVLVNGQRRVSGSATSSAVDVSTIPSSMIQRVEVLTGGAAAVYGADAVSGVVNVILKDRADGLELNVRQGLSSRGDGYTSSYEALWGGNIGDRGHITIGAAYTHDSPLYCRARSSCYNQLFILPNPANTGPEDGIPDNSLFRGPVTFPGWALTGTFVVDGIRYTYDQGLRQQNEIGNVYGPLSWLSLGGDGVNPWNYFSIFGKSKVVSAISHMDYDLSDDIALSTDLHFGQTRAFVADESLYTNFHPVTRDNPLIPADVAALMDANGLTSLIISRTDIDHGQYGRDVLLTTYTGAAKLFGQLSPTLKWSAFAQYGRFDTRDIGVNERHMPRYQQAVDVISDPVTGEPVCRDPAARAAGCLPISLFGANNATPEILSYFQVNRIIETTNQQFVAGANLTGTALTLPAGDVKFAAGAEYRHESLNSRVDGNVKANVLWHPGGSDVDASFNVKELYGEIVVPVIKEKEFFRDLEFTGALRYSDYNTIGSTTTWKLGGLYSPMPGVKFRVTKSRSVRAPNLIEFASPGLGSVGSFYDPCSDVYIGQNPNRAQNCAAFGIPPEGYVDPDPAQPRPVLTRGNPNLDPETSKSFTAGLVLQPSFLPGFNFSADYFDIRIKDAIATIGLQAIMNGCVDGPELNADLCDLITRNPGQHINAISVNVAPVNIAALHVRGMDFSADYGSPIGVLWGAPLRLDLSLIGTYNIRNDFVLDASHPEQTLHLAGLIGSSPKLKANLSATVSTPRVGFTWTARFTGKGHRVDDSNLTPEAYVSSVNDVGHQLYHDVNIDYDLTPRVRLGLGVTNLFDARVPSFTAPTSDTIGTRFFLNLRAKM